MKWVKQATVSLLAGVLLALQAVSPVFAEESTSGISQEKPETLVGELCVYTQNQGVHKVTAAL